MSLRLPYLLGELNLLSICNDRFISIDDFASNSIVNDINMATLASHKLLFASYVFLLNLLIKF